MQIKNIENMPISSILKNNLYLNGIIVSDKLFEKLKSSQYKGYTTTTGIFMKLGATLSRQEFEKQKRDNTRDTLLSEIPENLSYEDYLKIREYTTVRLRKASSIDYEHLKDSTYFILDTDKSGNLHIIGQYSYANNIYPIKIEDCGIFKQNNYKDNDVALQAGGIRLRTSICGSNCISGCKFCDFGKVLNIIKKVFSIMIENKILSIQYSNQLQLEMFMLSLLQVEILIYQTCTLGQNL